MERGRVQLEERYFRLDSMPPIPIGIAGPTYIAASKIANNQRTINLYPEIAQSPDGKGISSLMLIPTEGLLLNTNISATINTGIRGAWISGTTALMVFGNRIFRRTTGSAAFSVITGTVLNDSNPIFATSGAGPSANFSMLVSSGNGYTVVSNILGQISDPDFPTGSAVTCAYMTNLYIVLANSSSFVGSRIYVSDTDSPTVWDALDFTTYDIDGTNANSMVVDRQELWVFSTNRGGVFYNNGNADFPLALRPGGIIDMGNDAANSLANVDGGNIIWLAIDHDGDHHIVRAGKGVGYNPEIISDEGLEYLINSFSEVHDAIAFGVNSMYWITFPTAGRTFCYDLRTKLWHERLYFNALTGQYEAYLGLYHIHQDHQHIMGDRQEGLIYELDRDTYTDNGDTIYRERWCPHIFRGARGAKRITVKALRVLCEVGVGIIGASGQAGVDPLLQMQYSIDGGQTWSDTLEASIGARGNYDGVPEYRQLGSANKPYQFKIRYTDPTDFKIIEAYAEVETD